MIIKAYNHCFYYGNVYLAAILFVSLRVTLRLLSISWLIEDFLQNKTLLFIYPMHGAEIAVRLNSAITLKEPSILSIGIFWSAATGFKVSGCSTITHFLANKNQWFVTPSSMEPLAEFKQLFAKVIDEYQLNSSQIKMCIEANYTVSGQHYFTPLVIDLLNYTKPSAVILPTETPECRQFANYWMDQNDYPRLSIDKKFEVAEDHYDFSKLTSDEKDEIDQLIKSKSMQLTFSPPSKFLTVSKGLCGSAVRILKTNSMVEVQQQLGYARLQIDSVLTLDWNTSEAPSPSSPQAVFTSVSHSSDDSRSQPVTPSSPIVEYQVVSTPVSQSSDGSPPVTPSSFSAIEPNTPLVSDISSQQITPSPLSGNVTNLQSSKVFPTIGETHDDSDIEQRSSNHVMGSFLYRFFCRPCCGGDATDILSPSEKYKDGSSVAPLV